MTTNNSNKKKTDNPNEMFVYETEDGKSVELLPFNRLPAGVFRKSRNNDNEMDIMFSTVEAATDEAGLEVIDTLSIEELGSLFEKWAEASNTSPLG